MHVSREVTKDDLRLQIIVDEDPTCPRDWDNLGTMICFHSRYSLGDKHSYGAHHNFLIALADEVTNTEHRLPYMEREYTGFRPTRGMDGKWYNMNEIGHLIGHTLGHDTDMEAEADFEDLKREFLETEWKSILSNRDLVELIRSVGTVILPLYLYDHSGITMKTTPFGCSWDSGQVGYIYITRDKIEEEFGSHGGRTDDEIAQYLVNEVTTYDNYLTGEVYGYKVEKKVGCEHCGNVEWEELDACWGFYGDIEKSGILDEIPAEYKYLADAI
jgi:hypothetical protein